MELRDDTGVFSISSDSDDDDYVDDNGINYSLHVVISSSICFCCLILPGLTLCCAASQLVK